MFKLYEQVVQKLGKTIVQTGVFSRFYTPICFGAQQELILRHTLHTCFAQISSLFAQPNTASYYLFSGWFYTFSPSPISTKKET